MLTIKVEPRLIEKSQAQLPYKMPPNTHPNWKYVILARNFLKNLPSRHCICGQVSKQVFTSIRQLDDCPLIILF